MIRTIARHRETQGVRSAISLAGLAGVILAGGVLSGCGETEVGPPDGGTVVIADAGAPTVANPLIASDEYSTAMNSFLLFLPLVRFDSALELTPGLARSWNMESDTTAVLELHQTVRWSDDRPTTAEDVVFTLQRALEPETGYPNRDQINHIRGVEAVDSYTVRIRFEPVREPLAPLTSLAVVPRHVLGEVRGADLQSSSFNLQPVTNGPFRVVQARPGDRWVFAADTTHPEELGGRAHLDRLIWRAIPESSSMDVELQSGEVDVAVAVRSDVFDRLTAREGYQGIERPTLGYTGVAWNGRRPPLDDARVRRALSLAVDRTQILEGLRGGRGTLANGPVPRAHWANAESVSPLSQDVEKARTLLEEAGFRDSDGDGLVEDAAGEALRITLLFPANDDFNRDVAQVLQANFRAVGVALELRQLEFASLIQVITGPDRAFDGVLLGLNADPRLDLRGLFHSESLDDPFQVAGYNNPRMDSLLDAIETAERNRARDLWREVQEVLAEDQPWLYLHGGSQLIIARSRVNGIEADLSGLLSSVTDWWVDPES